MNINESLEVVIMNPRFRLKNKIGDCSRSGQVIMEKVYLTYRMTVVCHVMKFEWMQKDIS